MLAIGDTVRVVAPLEALLDIGIMQDTAEAIMGAEQHVYDVRPHSLYPDDVMVYIADPVHKLLWVRGSHVEVLLKKGLPPCLVGIVL